MMISQNKVFTTYSGGTALFFQPQTADLTSVSRPSGDTPVWSYDFEDTSYPIVFYMPELIVPDTLPPNHSAWKALEDLFEAADASETTDNEMGYEWWRELRANEDKRLSRLYGTEDWE